jgi:uncharacterized protein (TIGR02246 family)
MNTETAKATAEAEIRELVENWLKAVRTRDIDGVVSHYAPDIVAFDAIARLQFKGVEAYRKHWEACLSLCPGPTIFEIHDLNIAASDDLAFCHCLNRCGATDESGKEKASWMRATVCYRKINGTWRAVHEHWSAPFDMESGKALLDLEP